MMKSTPSEVIHKKSLSQYFILMGEHCKSQNITARELLGALGPDGHAIVALVLCFPFLTPIPLPGLSVLFGLLIASSGIGIALNLPIYLPNWLGQKSLPGETLSRVFFYSAKVLKKIERLFQPRLLFLFSMPFVRTLIGVLIAICGMILFLPLPPGTNFPPAIICVCMIISWLERDGIVLIVGLTLLSLMIWLGFTFAEAAMDYMTELSLFSKKVE